jgi:hypothetical protein
MMAEANITVDVLNMDRALALKAALQALVDAASNYVKPRRTTDARQILLKRIDAARAALAAQPTEPVAQFEAFHREDGSSFIDDLLAEPVALPEETIFKIWDSIDHDEYVWEGPAIVQFARAVLAAAGGAK